ncbi:hypothetical protein EUTSA_v10012279mg, partial [Eutrema salsugineum]
MIRGENSDSILHIDLIIEIFSRLPAKSIARFRCLSKQWGSIFLRPFFTDLFLTRSSARPPRLLFAPQNPYDDKSSSLVVIADSHMKFLGDNTWLEICGSASGLICFRRRKAISKADKLPVICNPSTGQYASLPFPKRGIYGGRIFLGFDPIDKQFKVFSVRYPNDNYDEIGFQYEILTLGTGIVLWRKIHCSLNHFPGHYLPKGICINGILYYLAEQKDETCYMIVCFDVRSEKFKFIYRDFFRYGDHTELINYKGILGVITWTCNDSPPGARRSLKLCLSVLKNVEKPESEWSEYSYTFWENQFPKYTLCVYSIVGVTATGEIVFSTHDASKPFYVFFFNPERSSLRSVEIQGFGAANHGASEKRSRSVRVFVDYVEDLKFITMKTTYNSATSISPPEQKREPKSTSSKAHLQQED